MKDRIIAFLAELNAALVPVANGERLDLYHIGRSALVWKHGFVAATEDVDVITQQGSERLMSVAIRLFGRGTAMAREHELYLEEVPKALPPVWGGCFKRATEVAERWSVIRLFHLEDHDFTVTKLKRFSTKDQEDIRTLSDHGLLDSKTLTERVRAAYPFHNERNPDKDDDPWAEAAFAHLKVVVKYLNEGEW
ncbi:MAG TPA: DUF6036 family nucleotidyltransferase [Gemmataceae bacterium]|nr:DUF6036 family nucleotidyltransferase [Gemmataceae bacterium]